jgi:hypothetical protein
MAKTVKWGSVRVSRGLDVGVALGITAIVMLWAISANRKAKQAQAEVDELADVDEQPEPTEGTVYL